MKHVSYATLPDKRRVYIDSTRLMAAGFLPGKRFDASFLVGKVKLAVVPDGDRTVSQKKKHGRIVPVIDIAGRKLEEALPEGRVRVVYTNGAIEIDVHPIEVRVRDRERRAAEASEDGVVRTGSVCSGIGVLDAALSQGLEDAGFATVPEFAIDVSEECLDLALLNNPALSGAMLVEGSLDEIDTDILGTVDLLSAGLPCTGASLSGRSKKGLARAEDDPNVGHLFVPFLDIVKVTNPSIVVLENVVPYSTTAGMEVIRNMMARLGYRLFELELDGSQWELESRTRMCVVAVSERIAPQGLEVRAKRSHQRLAEVLEPVPADSPRWNDVPYLKAKEERDTAAGKGFKRNVVTPESTSVGTIGTGYYKWRSTEPMLAHPHDPDFVRLLTPVEHARVKGIPEGLIEGASDTLAHQVLGQSIVYSAFRSVGQAIGGWLAGVA